jgi:hypothetical protein
VFPSPVRDYSIIVPGRGVNFMKSARCGIKKAHPGQLKDSFAVVEEKRIS